MVVELIDIAATVVEGAFLAGDRGTTRGPRNAGHVPMGGAMLAGMVTGMIAQNQKQTAFGSLLAGAAMPFLSHGKVTLGSIAMTAVTSTAVGMVTQEIKQHATALSEQRAAKKFATHGR